MSSGSNVQLEQKQYLLPYFESSVAVLSTIGVCLTGISLWAIAITRFSPLHAVPLCTSIACAVANGLCYYAFYTTSAPLPEAIASVFADIFWLLQEAGLPLYSYQILVHMLHGRARCFYKSTFWTALSMVVVIRVAIATMRAIQILDGSVPLTRAINFLHIGYFSSIAIAETYSSVLLIGFLRKAYRTALIVSSMRPVLRYLLWSTEVRLSGLCLVGIVRAATYPFQLVEQHAVNIPNQIDRFVYSLECLFPVLLIIDIVVPKDRGASELHKIISVSSRDVHHARRSLPSPPDSWSSVAPVPDEQCTKGITTPEPTDLTVSCRCHDTQPRQPV
ncbi:putative Tyrosyl-tRNA synthetase [Aspergillus niger]|nr:putative Tyrosyl-tRNA synthetase [Aspergillus niger]